MSVSDHVTDQSEERVYEADETVVEEVTVRMDRAVPIDDRAGTLNWVDNASVLWERRRVLIRTGIVSLVLALVFAFTMPKQYESSARIMPPGNSTGSAALLAALAGRSGLGTSSERLLEDCWAEGGMQRCSSICCAAALSPDI